MRQPRPKVRPVSRFLREQQRTIVDAVANLLHGPARCLMRRVESSGEQADSARRSAPDKIRPRLALLLPCRVLSGSLERESRPGRTGTRPSQAERGGGRCDTHVLMRAVRSLRLHAPSHRRQAGHERPPPRRGGGRGEARRAYAWHLCDAHTTATTTARTSAAVGTLSPLPSRDAGRRRRATKLEIAPGYVVRPPAHRVGKRRAGQHTRALEMETHGNPSPSAQGGTIYTAHGGQEHLSRNTSRPLHLHAGAPARRGLKCRAWAFVSVWRRAGLDMVCPPSLFWRGCMCPEMV